LLESNLELNETGAGSLQEFFNARPNLLLLMGESFGRRMWPKHYQTELVLLNEFRADYVVCDEFSPNFSLSNLKMRRWAASSRPRM
jgi:hypothetical protein